MIPTTIHSLWINTLAAFLRQAKVDVCWLRDSSITARQTHDYTGQTNGQVNVSSRTTLECRLIDAKQLRYRDSCGLPRV